MKTIKHIYWFAYYDLQEPSVRYRGYYALLHLKKESGISSSFACPGYRIRQVFTFAGVFLSALFSSSSNSIIIYENIRTTRLYAAALKLLLFMRPRNTIYDIDDADYLRFPPDTIHYFMKRCSVCTVGSSALAEYAGRYNNHVRLLTSPVMRHSHLKKKRNGLLTIGWVGYYGAHKDSLMRLFFPVLKAINFPLKLVLLGVEKQEHIDELKEYFSNCTQLVLDMPRSLNWQDEENVYSRIVQFDVGVSPLLDTEFNRAKSAFKMKQYFSCGVPVLGSSTGENSRFLAHGSNGYFCDSPQEYAHFIEHMKNLTDSEYQTMSLNAVNTMHGFDMEYYNRELMRHIFYCTDDVRVSMVNKVLH